MRQLITSLLAGTFALSTMAAVEIPVYMTSDFEEDLANERVPEGWTSSGINSDVTGNFARFFKSYSSENAFSLMEYKSMTGMFSPSEFESGEASDQWLITPEFTIGDDESILTFNVGATGNYTNNAFRIMISESGTSRDDFYEIYGGTVKGDGENLVSGRHSVSLPGYKGMKVNLAFVNSGSKEGMTGFSDISVAPYFIRIANAESYENYIFTGNSRKLAMTVGLTTPVNTNGFTAKLSLSNGFETEYVSKLKFDPSKLVEDSFEFPDDVEIAEREMLDYTITITPNYKGAPSTVMTGKMMTADMLYGSVVLMEEFTGTWCQFCPYGYSIMNYYVDAYDGSDNGGKAIAVAIHNDDPMTVEYLDKEVRRISQALGGFGGLPNLMVNRVKNMHPADAIDYMNNILSQKTFVTTDIAKVKYDEETREGVVTFDVKGGFTTDNTGFKALLIITENNLSGKGSDWYQVNALYGLTETDIARDLGREFVPYFDIFIGAESSNPVRNITYPDVARDYFPTPDGVSLPGGLEYDMPTQHSLGFSLTENVTDINESVVTVVILDSFGRVLTADSMKYSEFSKSSVGSMENESISIAAEEGRISVTSDCEGMATAYTPDGRVITSARINAGVTSLGDFDGLVIVKVTAGDNSRTAKIIVK